MTRRIRRRPFRLLAWALFALALSIALALGAAESSWGKERIRRLAVSQAARLIRGSIAIGQVRGSLLRGVALEDVVISQDGGPVISADRIEVRYDLWTLARHIWRLDQVTVTHPRVRLRQDDRGWNLTRLPASDGQGGAVAFSIASFRLQDGDVSIEPSHANSRRLESLDLTGGLDQSASGVAIRIDSATGYEQRSGYSVRAFRGSLVGGLDRVRFDLRADRGLASLAVSGLTAAVADGLRLSASVDADNLDAAAFFDDPHWASNVTGDGRVEITFAREGTTSLDFSAAGAHASAFGYEGTDYQTAGTYADGDLRFSAAASAYGGHATATGSWRLGAAGPVEFQSRGRFDRLALARLPSSLHLPPLRTNLAGFYEAHVSGSRVDAKVRLESSEVEGASAAPGTVGQIAIGPREVAYQVDGRLSHLDVQQLAGPLGLTSLAADRWKTDISGGFSVHGSEPCARCTGIRRIEAHAAVDHAQVVGATIPTADVNAQISGTSLDVRVAGDLKNASAEALSLTSLPMALNGHVDGQFRIPDLDNPADIDAMSADGRVDLGPSSVAGVTLQDAHVDACLLNGVATIRQLSVTGPALRVAMHGTAAIGTTGESDLTVAVDVDDMSRLPALVSQTPTGVAHLRAAVTGRSSHPVITGELEARDVGYAGRLTALTLNTTFSVDFPERGIAGSTMQAWTNGTFVTIGPIQVSTLSASATLFDRDMTVNLEAADQTRKLGLFGVISLEPWPRALQLQSFSLASGDTLWGLPPQQVATLSYRDGRLAVDGLHLERGDQRIAVDGALGGGASDQSGGKAAVLTAAIAHVQVADVNRMLLGARRLEGTADGDVTITGSVDAPVIEANLTVANGRVEDTPLESLTARVRHTAAATTVDAEIDATSTSRLTVSGTIPGAASAGGALDLRVESASIDLGLAQVLTTEVTRLSGTAQMDVHVGGVLAQPVITGQVTVHDGALTVESTGGRYSQLNGAVLLQGNRATLQGLQMIDDDRHSLRADGTLMLATDPAARTVDVHVVSDSFRILNNTLGDVHVSADLHATGALLSPVLSGRLRVDSGRLEVDRILEKTARNLYSETASSVAEETSSPGEAAGTGSPEAKAAAPAGTVLDRAAIEVTLDMPDNVVLRGRGLRTGSAAIGLGDINLIAGGSLAFHKSAGTPLVVQGDVRTVRGTYTFQGRRFDLERDSEVRFRGESPINPILDLTASRDVSDLTTHVHVQGTADRPRITLSSEPPLEEADVLALIVFGQPLNDLGSGERTSLAQRAGSMAAGVATPVADSVARALDLDLFELETPTDAERAPVISAGDQIGSHIYVGVRREIGGDENTALSFEYRINRLLRLVTSFAEGALQAHSASSASSGGLDLLFVLRY